MCIRDRIIPAVFAFSGGDPDTLKAGPALMFITIPKVFANMGLGTGIGILFFLLVLFAAMTSSIALTESAVSTFEEDVYKRQQLCYDNACGSVIDLFSQKNDPFLKKSGINIIRAVSYTHLVSFLPFFKSWSVLQRRTSISSGSLTRRFSVVFIKVLFNC